MSGTFVLGEDAINNVGRISDGMMPQTASIDHSSLITRIDGTAGSQSGNDPSIPEAYHFKETSKYGV